MRLDCKNGPIWQGAPFADGQNATRFHNSIEPIQNSIWAQIDIFQQEPRAVPQALKKQSIDPVFAQLLCFRTMMALIVPNHEGPFASAHNNSQA